MSATASALLVDPDHQPLWRAAIALAACAARVAWSLVVRSLHQPRSEVGHALRFSDGSAARTYRLTVRDHGELTEPAMLIVTFRLRGVRREWQHAAFRVESVLNTLLFAGFPGFVSKRWVDHDAEGRYRGVYQWNGAARAAAYVGSLWWVLSAVAERGSIHAVVVPGVRTDDALMAPVTLDPYATSGDGWWRPV